MKISFVTMFTVYPRTKHTVSRYLVQFQQPVIE